MSSNIYLYYENYTEQEFEQFRVKLKSYVDRLDKGEELSGKGEVLEFFKLYNTIIPTINNNSLELVPQSSCSTCTKRLRNNVANYFLLNPFQTIKENDSTNNSSGSEIIKRGRPKKT